MSAATTRQLYGKALLWGAALVASVLLGRYAADLLNLEGVPAKAILLLPTMLIVPFMKSMQTAEAAAGFHSPARGRFNQRALFLGLAYVALLLVAIAMKQSLQPGHSAIWMLALLPVLPIVFMVAAIKRYLDEETDEFLRDNFVMMSLAGTGTLILCASCWGFLENFGAIGPADGTLAPAVWALGAVVGDLYWRWKGR